MGGSSGTNTVTNNAAPWAPQQGYITNGLANDQAVYNTNTAAGPYTGNFTAGPNNFQSQAETAAANYGNFQGLNLSTQAGNTAQSLMGAAQPYVNNASGIAANGIGGPNAGLMSTLQGYGTGAQTTSGPNAGLSGALNNAAINGANSLTGFQNGLTNAANSAAGNPTSQIAANAGTYMNSAPVQSAISNVNNQIDQTLHEQTLPGLNQAAAMGGSLNSSRAGMAEAMANEGAGIAQGNADSAITNNAWNTGMGTASNQYSAGLNASVNANLGGIYGMGSTANNVANQQTQLGEFNTGTQLGAANSGLSQGLGYGMGNANTMLSANSQLGNAANLGYNGATTAGNLTAGDVGLLSGAGQMQQQGQQSQLQNQLQQWQMQNQYQQGILNNYMGIAGQPLGSQSNGSGSTQNSGPGVAGSVLGAGAGLMGLNQASGGALSSGLSSAWGGLFGSGAGAAMGGTGLASLGALSAAGSTGVGLAALGGSGTAADMALMGGALL